MKKIALAVLVLCGLFCPRISSGNPIVPLEIYASTYLYQMDMLNGRVSELEGDLHAHKGNDENALSAYQAAMDSFQKAGDDSDNDADFNKAYDAWVKVYEKYNSIKTP